MDGRMNIRCARKEDAARLLEIYAPYVEKTAITFEYDVPTAEEFVARMERVMEKYPYLVAERDGEILGYAYAASFHLRAAYGWCAETSIYVDMGRRGGGIGGALYQKLEEALAAQGILNLNACIGFADPEDEYLKNDSVSFHAHFGYVMVGRFHRCGWKFGRWYDMVWMEKMLGKHGTQIQPVKRFDEVKEELGL